MKTTLIAALAAGASAASTQSLYGQCGGSGYTGPTICPTGATCYSTGPYYAQCTPAAGTVNPNIQSVYGQCGGSGWSGPSSCSVGSFCSTQNAYYAQCTPSAAADALATSTISSTKKGKTSSIATKTSTVTKASSHDASRSTSTKAVASSTAATSAATSAKASTTAIATTSKSTTTAAATTTKAASTTTKATTSTAAATSAAASGKVRFAGVNIAGCDFGIDTSGDSGTPTCPTSVGPTQMQHFVSQDGLNIFRLPAGWQYLTPTLGGTLDPTFFSEYDGIMQACLATGAYCILDVHNYARWNGGIIGQGGPTNAQFTSLWTQLATKYAADSRVIFGIMNEPHDLTMSTWATTVQAAVTAIRATGAKSQMILLPGTQYTSAEVFATQSAPYLSTVTDSDGTVSKLIYDIHRYLDSDGSGTHTTCTENAISDSFQPLATYLRSNKRQALLSETGGSNDPTCLTYVCQELAYLNQNSDVYLGWVGWAAGSFATSYVLSETPNGNTDQAIVSQCIAGEF